ncbi:protein rogdi-like isoform X2 [Mizuhopecten yessoensis]|uniref:protein rogdi-like isoform X2 n=1 Tax=Mizuhopecten yessoensis TaxID=6573 RepID=UPI000B458E70|nr:protein rogdi-like isoform X2 [Mizuhopecten yessoensis]
MEENAEEIEVLRKELEWLLQEQVHQVLEEVHETLVECCRRFLIKASPGDHSLVHSQRILMSSPNGGINQVKCVITLLGDSICDADITFKHKQGKDHSQFRTGFGQERVWKLQQIQDASNFLYTARLQVEGQDRDHTYKSAKEVILILDEVMKNLTQGRSCLAFPKRKSIDELVNNVNMQMLYPHVPSDVALSFYVHSSKLVLALYHLHLNGQQRMDITSRNQVECTIQWLNEAVMLFTLALQKCQQLKDKIVVLQQYEKVL